MRIHGYKDERTAHARLLIVENHIRILDAKLFGIDVRLRSLDGNGRDEDRLKHTMVRTIKSPSLGERFWSCRVPHPLDAIAVAPPEGGD